ncbi:MAG TPA: zf-HC2 domain-containing protein [Ktedonobacterales bacterium]|jgi:hypothetical protein|nr:zf-HC2 domain-containing protein [Ktedonobacterales bacterium]
MTLQEAGHVADLLPAYLNGALDEVGKRRVEHHLESCAMCQSELASVDALRRAARLATAATPGPAPELFSHILVEIETSPVSEAAASVVAPSAQASFWQLLRWQPRMIYRAIWIASTVGVAAVTLYAVAITLMNPRVHGAAPLVLFLPLFAAMGAAFLYGPEADPSLEVTLAAPVSTRAVLFTRMVLLLGYQLALGLAATTLVAILQGASPWMLALEWLGPMAILSSGSLLLSLLVSPVIGAGASLAVWIAQFIQFHLSLISLTAEDVATSPIWQTTPTILALAAVLFVAALIYVPRQERLA